MATTPTADADTGRYIRYAAPAPTDADEREALQSSAENTLSHQLCEDWAWWCHTRKYAGAPRQPNMNSIARWATPMRATASTGGDGPMSQRLRCLNTAIVAQPHGKARQAFLMYYLDRVRPVKRIADALGVGRPHVYTLIEEFRAAAVRAAGALAQQEVVT